MRLAVFGLLAVFLGANTCSAFGEVLPLTVKEMSLMLRSGYSSEAVLRELAARRLADTFDSAAEKQLTQAGANQSLIEALQSGAYQLSESEVIAARQKLEERAALKVDQPLAPTTSASKEVMPEPGGPASAPLPPDAIYRLLKNDLVYWHEGSLVHFDDEVLEHKKIFVFFFSGNSSAPGRKFTPQLVDYYNRVAPEHPEFEIVFFSVDRSQFGMETYVGQSNMPWPMVAYDKLASKGLVVQKFVHGVPCVIVLSGSGNILFNSYGTEKDLGPEKALEALDKILNGDATSKAASG
jgi:hypothetical protein